MVERARNPRDVKQPERYGPSEASMALAALAISHLFGIPFVASFGLSFSQAALVNMGVIALRPLWLVLQMVRARRGGRKVAG